MYFKVIVLFIAIQSIGVYGLKNRLKSDGNNDQHDHGILIGDQITEAGKHILAKITEARAAKYSHLQVFSVTQAEAVKHVDQILTIFQNVTQGFDSQPCLRIEENLMGRTIENNCYALINSRIVAAIPGKYESTVGEKAFMNTDNFPDEEIGYEFFLGPLYFGVYTTKP